MTETLSTIMNESTYQIPEQRRISAERARNIREHLLPILGGATLAVTLMAGAHYELTGPTKDRGESKGTIHAGEGVIAAAEQAREEFEARTGIELPYSDVVHAAQMSHGVADKNGTIQPGNIELHVAESPLLGRRIITVTGDHLNDK